ncbi:unnamed protein product [Nesidiocoris tenuis]|uniref:Uncharacterized protein n=1 Tax=Nesidiocoris tenuis TaxID=355587 RepID=A0A6H5HJ75_9HEMI|nr:unnamed protein product [Nesidiocoris tenuis]
MNLCRRFTFPTCSGVIGTAVCYSVSSLEGGRARPGQLRLPGVKPTPGMAVYSTFSYEATFSILTMRVHVQLAAFLSRGRHTRPTSEQFCIANHNTHFSKLPQFVEYGVHEI